MKYQFVSEDKFLVCGRGTAFVTKNPHDCDDFSHLVNQMVEINGKEYKCIGVERFAHCPPWRKNEPISLLVEGEVDG